MVTAVPPEVGPEAGVIAEMLGAEDSGRSALLLGRYPPELPQEVSKKIAAMTKVPTIFPPKEARYRSRPDNIIHSSHLPSPENVLQQAHHNAVSARCGKLQWTLIPGLALELSKLMATIEP